MSMRIIFMGTPEFAVPSLEILLENGYEIVAVVTAPDKPGGRMGIQQSAVKRFAAARGLPVLQPEKLKNPEFLEKLANLKPDLQIVVAFRMLPEVVWSMPRLGTMNLHGSLLPKYRGAAPINWAIINGEKVTGVTTFLLRHQIDTGDLLMQEEIAIDPDMNAGALHDRMMIVGAALVLKSVKALESGDIQPRPQSDAEASHAPKIYHDTCQIRFDQPAARVHDFIRGLSPYPGAWTMWQGKTVKILRSTLPERTEKNLPPGQWSSDGKTRILIGASDGAIQIQELQLEGKKRMTAKEFLNGHKVADAT